MRTLFLLLVAANLALFAWCALSLARRRRVDPAAARAGRSSPRSCASCRRAELAGLPRRSPNPGSRAPAPRRRAPAPAPARRGACIEWGSFTLADAPRAEQALEPLALGARLAQRRSEETAGWWVFIPPQGNRAAAR